MTSTADGEVGETATGVTSERLHGLRTVIAVAGADVAMILLGWLQELMNPPGRTHPTMLPFWFGTVAGAGPWAAIVVNFVGPWRDYAFGEKTYLVLSLIAKSLLAWQIVGGSLAA